MEGKRIKQLREEKGLKQDELAEKLSISPSAVGMYERDEREPSDEIKIKIADFFNVSIDYLLGKTDKKNNTENKKELEINWALSGGYAALNDTNREIAKSVIESLLAKQEQEKKGEK